MERDGPRFENFVVFYLDTCTVLHGAASTSFRRVPPPEIDVAQVEQRRIFWYVSIRESRPLKKNRRTREQTRAILSRLSALNCRYHTIDSVQFARASSMRELLGAPSMFIARLLSELTFPANSPRALGLAPPRLGSSRFPRASPAFLAIIRASSSVITGPRAYRVTG